MIRNRRTGEVLADAPVVADTLWTRLRGLLGRARLEEGEALVLEPCPSVHMFFMRFPLDVLFLDAAGRVVAVYEDLRPWAVSGYHQEATRAVEVPVGTLARTGTEVGDLLEIEPSPRPRERPHHGRDLAPPATRAEGERGGAPRAGPLRIVLVLAVLVASLLQVATQPTHMLLVALTVAAGALYALSRRRLTPPPPPLAAVVLWLGFHVLHAALVTPAPYAARVGLGRRSVQAGAVILGVSAGAVPGGHAALASAAALAGAVHGGVALYDHVGESPTKAHWAAAAPGERAVRRVGGLFGNPNLLGLALALALPFALALAAGAGNRGRLLAWIAAGLIGAGLGVSYSRSSWIAALAGVGALLWRAKGGERRRVLRAASVAAMAALLVAPGHLGRAASATSASEFGMAQRVALYRGAAAMALEHPVAGHGAGTFHAAFPRYRLLGGQYPFDAHGQLLQEAVETGAPGLFVFLLVGLSGALAARRAARADPGPLRRGAAAAAVTLGVGMLFASPLAYTALAVPGLLAFGAAAAPDRSARPRAEGAAEGSGTRWILGAALVGACAMALWVREAELERGVVRMGIRGLEGMEAGPELRERWSELLVPDLVARLERAESLDPGAPVHPYLEGRLLLALGLAERAEVAFRETLRRDPYESLAWKGIAEAREARGELASAVEALDRALELDPRAERLLLEKAELLRVQGSLEAAGALLEEALRTNPAFLGINRDTYPEVLRALISLRAAQGREDEAEGYRQMLVELYGR